MQALGLDVFEFMKLKYPFSPSVSPFIYQGSWINNRHVSKCHNADNFLKRRIKVQYFKRIHTVKWNDIMLSLQQLKLPLYLGIIVSSCRTDRTLIYNTDTGKQFYKITEVKQQGLVLESLLWNTV